MTGFPYNDVLPPKQPGRHGELPTPRAFVFASDPQYPWTPASDLDLEQSASDRNKESEQLINEQYANIADYRASRGGMGIPVMINGDMTAYGHGWQREVLYPILQNHLQDNYYFGLGNHDYETENSFNNGGPRDSILDLINHNQSRVDTMDIRIEHNTIQDSYDGSLAYSKSFGRVRLIQLNNEPTFRRGFTSGWAWPLEQHHRFNITGSLDWLEGQLMEAYNSGQIILLNLHKPDHWADAHELPRFRAMIRHYQVNAVFAGHIHLEPGRFHRGSAFGSIPVYLSGSASQSTYLIAELDDAGHHLTVRLVRGNNWHTAEDLNTIRLYR